MAKGKPPRPDGRATCLAGYVLLILLVVYVQESSRARRPVRAPPERREWGRFPFCQASACAGGPTLNRPRPPAIPLQIEPQYAREYWAVVEQAGIPRFQINTHDPVTQDVYISGAIHGGKPWDEAIVAYLAHVLRHGPAGAFVDVGANIGYFTLMAASLGRNVTAFEPMDRNVAKILASVERNRGMRAWVRLFHNAVGQDACGGVTLEHTHATNQGNGKILDGATGPAPVVRLDDALDEDVIVMKIDVEGHEAQVLAGARRLICTRRVHHIVLELSVDTVLRPDCPIYDTLRTMQDIGYSITDVAPNAPRLSPHDVARFPPNIVLRLDDPTLAPAQRQAHGCEALTPPETAAR
jgi:FkbM family methyltransferase